MTTDSTQDSKQALFNKVVEGLASQKFQRSLAGFDYDGRPACAYRGTNGMRCAAGWLISDKDYRPEIENTSVEILDPNLFGISTADGFQHAFPDSPTSPTARLLVFLGNMQRCHDLGNNQVKMATDLQTLGEQEGLSIPEVLSSFIKNKQ